MSVRIVAAVFLLVSLDQVSAAEPESPEAAVRRVLAQWPKDFNARNKAGIFAFFAPDLVASYPGQPDRDFEAMCKHLAAALDHPTRRFRYDAPQIHQVMVSGDLAVVRLTWTLRITAEKEEDKVVREHGMDVFKRQKDGTWKCAISYAYPEKEKRAPQER
jgi:uncharacterized protein (TIGR02246 family)